MERKYNLINYFDVYKDSEGFWCVNDQYVERYDVTIADAATNKDIVNYLMQEGFLNTNDMRKLTVQEYGENIEIYQKKDMIPLFGFVPTF